MTDLDLWKAISRAINGIQMSDASMAKAIAEVRALLAEAKAEEAAASRVERSAPDRKERGGRDRATE